MKLSKTFTTVTPLSKTLALALFFLFPILGFYFGRVYQKELVQVEQAPSSKRATDLPLLPVVFETADKSFRFQYPSNWQLLQNQVYDDSELGSGLFGQKRLQTWDLASPQGGLTLSFREETEPKKPLNQLLNCDAPFRCAPLELNGQTYLANYAQDSVLPVNLMIGSTQKLVQISVIEKAGTSEDAQSLFTQLTQTFEFHP